MTLPRAASIAPAAIAVRRSGRASVIAMLCALGVAAPAAAATHKILVLPVDGNADAATRTKLTARIVKLAKTLDGHVATAEATFADTALAVGCDPQASGCSDMVLATLGVDELVWGTATRSGGQTRLVVRRAVKGAAPREIATTIAAGESTEVTDTAIAPLFAPTGEASPGAPPSDKPVVPTEGAAAPEAAPPAAEPATASPGITAAPGPAPDYRDRNLAIGLTAGGGAVFVLGLALLASYSSQQNRIDDHATRDLDDFEDLKSLESRAASYAIAGDICVVVGLAAGGIGAYYFYRNHQRSRVAVLPAVMGHGAGLTLTIVGAP